MEATGFQRTSMQKMVTKQLRLRTLTKGKMNWVTRPDAEKRLAACPHSKQEKDYGYELGPCRISLQMRR